jgi:dolichol-phosphate mannosyltransferase
MQPRSKHAGSPALSLIRYAIRQRIVQLTTGVIFICFLFLYFFAGGSSTYTPPAPRNDEVDPTRNTIHASIIVPTYHERDNIRPLVTRTFAALREPTASEIVLVDDNSGDGTVEEVEKLREEGYNVRVIVRTDAKGLSSAVLKGFEEARGQSLVVMDADLQHPPEAVQRVIDALEDPTTPFALGTRYGPGTHMSENWPIYRRIISWGARVLSRPLTTASDPMSGFFGIRKEYVSSNIF